MRQIIDQAMLTLSSSLAASIIAKATVILTLALLGAWLARRRRASMRHTFLAAAFGVLLILPVASVIAPPFRIAVPSAVPERPVLSPLPSAVNPVSPSTTTNAYVASTVRQSLRLSPADLLLAGWLMGTMLFLLPMFTGLWQLRSLRRSALPWRGGQSVTESLAMEVGINRQVDVLLHQALPGPMTCGIMHPSILLPPDAQSWDKEDLTRAIVHELEHVRRGDWLTHCLSRAVCAMYWLHPLAWIAQRQLSLEAERACDDAVIARSEATAYADQLVGLAQRLSTARKSPALAMANRSDLSARVRAVLDGRKQRGRAGAILVALVCAVAAVVIVTMSPLSLVAASSLEFEVASIKPIDPGAMHMTTPRVYPGGRVVMEAINLKGLVSIAFGLSGWQISGGDAWMLDDKYDVEAKPPASLQPAITNLRHSNWAIEDERLREMLQSLLIDRFHLKFHRETKTGKVYLLERKGETLRLRPTEAPRPPSANSPDEGLSGFSGDVGFAGGRWVIFNTAMPQLAKFAADHILHAPVLDRTGLSGSFDYKQPTRLPDSEVDYSDPSGPFLNLIPELGLKFESAQGPVESFVIDSADRPTPN